MKNSIQNQVVEGVSNNVVDYFSNSITSSDFVEKHIKTIVTVSEEQEEKICDILAEYNRDWDNADCDAEGATQEQDAELDIIIDNCAKAIADVVALI
jgi:spore germination protein YaaH